MRVFAQVPILIEDSYVCWWNVNGVPLPWASVLYWPLFSSLFNAFEGDVKHTNVLCQVV